MGIVFRHDAAAVAVPSNSGTRKYGQQLVLQQQQQKYNAQQAGYDRMFQLNRDYQQNAFAAAREQRQQAFIGDRDKAQNAFQLERDKALLEQQRQQQEAMRQQKFMDDARKQSSGIIMDGIKNGEYDPATARKLQQNLVEESEVLGNPALDATQRAEALQKLRAERAMLSSNRLEKPPEPTPQEKFEQSIITDPQTGMRYFPNARGGLEPLPESKQQQQMRPKSFQDYYSENEDKFQKDLDATMQAMQVPDKDGKVPEVTQERALAKMQKDYEFRQKALGRPVFGTPTEAPELPGSQPPVPGQSKLILEPSVPSGASNASDYDAQMQAKGYKLMTPANGATPFYYRDSPPAQSAAPADPEFDAAMQAKGYKLMTPANGASPFYYRDSTPQAPERGAPPAPVQPAPTMAARPDPGMPPTPQQVKVGGKPLAVTPGTLTPQETEAKAKIMAMPQEDRIKSLMQYDPQFKGKSLDQILEDPESKAKYDELSKQGLTTGNYRADMLNHMDDVLQNNVLKQMPQDAYVGMRADEITDPKAKEEVAKMPRPKSPEEMNGIRGPYFIDPTGIIRSTRRG